MDFTVHRIRKSDSLEALSAYYRVPVCMIMRANRLNDPEGFKGLRELKIPQRRWCNDCAAAGARKNLNGAHEGKTETKANLYV